MQSAEKQGHAADSDEILGLSRGEAQVLDYCMLLYLLHKANIALIRGPCLVAPICSKCGLCSFDQYAIAGRKMCRRAEGNSDRVQ